MVNRLPRTLADRRSADHPVAVRFPRRWTPFDGESAVGHLGRCLTTIRQHPDDKPAPGRPAASFLVMSFSKGFKTNPKPLLMTQLVVTGIWARHRLASDGGILPSKSCPAAASACRPSGAMGSPAGA